MVRMWSLVRLAGLLIAGGAAMPGGAMSQQPGYPGVVFEGSAQTGADTRPVRFRFYCSANSGPNVTGALAVAVEVPRAEQLKAVFDFDPFEGPDASAGSLTRLQATGARSKSQGDFSASGFVPAPDPDASFVLEVSAARRGDAARLATLANVMRALVDSPSRLLWRQGNATKGGTPMSATLDLAKDGADQLRAALGSCLGTR
jgi:hypothetical protein